MLSKHPWHGSTTRTGTSPLKAEINILKTKVSLGFGEVVEGSLFGNVEEHQAGLLALKLILNPPSPKPYPLKHGTSNLSNTPNNKR